MSTPVIAVFNGGNSGSPGVDVAISGISGIKAGDSILQVLTINTADTTLGADFTSLFAPLVPADGVLVQLAAAGNVTSVAFLALLSRG